ncbi:MULTISPECIES: GMC family oxidoreductase [unclassified Pseudoalteromonas]|uniref:GMC family oxidoreductase n=1 Tax=unclassified Pseudoalteromonas TaxID=194690 RepID=UPI00209806F8|nr:GMC family oxidoreductase [Pseudoalteromonas sp. XMcav2-N]MCO7189430.1 GMC family oxidoreductase [Pseudoalteromonas sp. XMcav2-N]
MTHHHTEYDVVIVGAGIAGAIMAKQLGEQGKKVLILEAGTGTDGRFFDQGKEKGYESYMSRFFTAMAKIPNAPYPNNPNAPQPLVTDIQKPPLDKPVSDHGYFVQYGPDPFASTYTRSEGGTTLHWLGTCLRMLPEDFELKTRFGRGRDWPISYQDLQPWYEIAEQHIGVSANADVQTYQQIDNPSVQLPFEENYDYPMEQIPQSFLDQYLAKGLQGMQVEIDNQPYPIDVVATPQGRNGMPRGDYRPVGAVGNPDLGQRCAGNSNCVPICPIQAKYSALKTLEQAKNTGNVTIETQAVAYNLEVDHKTQSISKVHYKRYHSTQSAAYDDKAVKAKVVVLAAHAVENAKLMLASNVANSSDQVGRNLMDHPTMLTWGLMPCKIGAFRGPGSTSGIPSLRGGAFRAEQAAFRIEIGNWGWSWPEGAPIATVPELIDEQNLFGPALRHKIAEEYPRMFRFGFLVEQLPDPDNRVTIDDQYRDQLGNYRPVIHYKVTDYTRAGMAQAKEVSDAIFQRLGVEPFTKYKANDPGYVQYQGKGYVYNGAGHLVGTHLMGDDPKTSVVNREQRSWDHPNLYLVGCGNMPTIATSNPTLTMAALTFWAADNVLNALDQYE